MLMSSLDFLLSRFIFKLSKIDTLHIAGSSICGNQPIIHDLRMHLVLTHESSDNFVSMLHYLYQPLYDVMCIQSVVGLNLLKRVPDPEAPLR